MYKIGVLFLSYNMFMKTSYWNIFKTFFKIGTMLLGGGYVILPLLQSEIAEKRQWIEPEDIVEYFAVSQSLPGVIAANVSIFVGYKLRGILGALAAITGVITPAFLAIILLANIMEELVTKHGINSALAGVAVGVVVLIVLTVKEVWAKVVIDKFTLVIFFAALILACCGVSPVLITLGSVVVGVLYKLRAKTV